MFFYENNLLEFGKLAGDFVNNYHIYALDWTPKYLKFYVDGILIAKSLCKTSERIWRN